MQYIGTRKDLIDVVGSGTYRFRHYGEASSFFIIGGVRLRALAYMTYGTWYNSSYNNISGKTVTTSDGTTFTAYDIYIQNGEMTAILDINNRFSEIIPHISCNDNVINKSIYTLGPLQE